MTVQTEPLPHSSVIWVLIEGVQKPPTHWTYTLSKDAPGSVRDANIQDRPIPAVRPYHSYTELCTSLHTYGVTPPSRDYFTPTLEELADSLDSIVRGVMRPG